MINYSNYVKEQLKNKELFPDIRLFAQKHKIPIVDLDTALFLEMIVAVHLPKRILEIGAAIGYSTLYLWEHFSGERLTTIELSSDNLRHLRKNLPLDDTRIELIEGDALQVLKNTDLNDLDLIFVDARKKDYISYLELVRNKLNAGGLIIFDNIFWHGAVTGNPIKERYLKSRDELQMFTRSFLEDKQFVSTIVNVGDGLALGVKRG